MDIEALPTTIKSTPKPTQPLIFSFGYNILFEEYLTEQNFYVKLPPL